MWKDTKVASVTIPLAKHWNKGEQRSQSELYSDDSYGLYQKAGAPQNGPPAEGMLIFQVNATIEVDFRILLFLLALCIVS